MTPDEDLGPPPQKREPIEAIPGQEIEQDTTLMDVGCDVPGGGAT